VGHFQRKWPTNSTLSQYKVFGPYGLIARVDLAWPEYKIAVEYDGLWHVGSAQQMDRDRRRLNQLVAEGWIVLHVTAARMRDDFANVVAEIRTAIRGRSCRLTA
jgi:very-short-patch-repair endonuclease